MKQSHRLDFSDIDEFDELDEISGDAQLQFCFIWCDSHLKYEWHWIWVAVK